MNININIHNKLNKKDIVDGYKGIMELDLTNVPEKLKKQLAQQHMKDIDNYKGEQAKLKSHLRYENTVERIRKLHAINTEQLNKRSELQRNNQYVQNKRYNSRINPQTNIN